jgi:hypothetical protein
MQPILIEVYRGMLARHRCTVDDILCDPEYRNEFVATSRRSAGNDATEKDILKLLTNLRKRSKLPRSRDE